jgi:hypothetical protein
MSLREPTERDFVTAAHFGMANFFGDAEVGNDLGIPTDDGTLHDHIAAGREVAATVVADPQDDVFERLLAEDPRAAVRYALGQR